MNAAELLVHAPLMPERYAVVRPPRERGPFRWSKLERPGRLTIYTLALFHPPLAPLSIDLAFSASDLAHNRRGCARRLRQALRTLREQAVLRRLYAGAVK
jgi:hypothetical protein